MKKGISLLLVFMMAALACCAAAEGTAYGTLDWRTAGAGYAAEKAEGGFVLLTEVGMKIWVPDRLARLKAEPPTVCAFSDDAYTLGFSAFLEDLPEEVPAGDRAALISYIAAFAADEGSAEGVLVNGLFCVMYTMGAGEQQGVTFFAENGQMLTCVFDTLGETESENNTLIRLMCASIMPLDADTGEE